MSGRCFRDYSMNVDFKAIKIDYKFYCPQCGKVLHVSFEKMLNITFFAEEIYLEKKVSLICWAGIMSVGALFS